jgi:hypothetical protein
MKRVSHTILVSNKYASINQFLSLTVKFSECAGICGGVLTDKMITFQLFLRSFLYAILCTLLKAEVKIQRYAKELSLDNKVSKNTNLLVEHQVDSFPECPALCGQCACFGFHPQLKKCRIHVSCDPSYITTNEAGWVYFSAERGMLFQSQCI